MTKPETITIQNGTQKKSAYIMLVNEPLKKQQCEEVNEQMKAGTNSISRHMTKETLQNYLCVHP